MQLNQIFRSRGTNRSGGKFDALTVQLVWNKATPMPGHDANQVRKDSCGAIMHRSQYGNTESSFGWEVDHVRPVSKGGGDELANLQALQWENNRGKGDDWPNWTCAVTWRG
jgi:hypothetical protein